MEDPPMKYCAVHTPARAVPFVMRASCKFSRTSLTLLLLLPILLVTPQSLKAQAVYGSIVGTVSDPTGAVIPGATITVTDVSKGISQTVTVNGSGNYEVTRLVPDIYQVKVTFKNFAPAEADNVAVTADNAQQVNLQMQPAGAAAQTVTVTAAPPPLQTEEQQVSQNLDERQVQSLPNIDRNASNFALLTPGVQRASFSIDPTENPQGTVAVEANGMNYGTVGWLLDGTDNREPVLGIIVINPTLDSLSNMEIITSNYPAEFGGAVGGFVTAQTKSGSNTFHGDAFDFRRSGALAARDPFTQSPGIPFPGQLYNQFGGSVGGPILKNRAFFFLDYQGTRQRVGQTVQTNVPTALVRSTCLSGGGICDLSQYASTIYNPGTGTSYPANAVPLSALTPQGIALLNAFPMPNSGAATSTTNNYVASGNGEYNGDQADMRLDAQVKQDIHTFARYDYSNFRLFGVPVFGAAGGTGFGIGNTTGTDNAQNQSAAAGADWAINQNLLTDVRFGFLDYHIAENKYDAGTNPASAIGLPNLNTSVPGTSGSPTYNVEDNSISSFGTQGCNCPLLESEQVFQLANNWTKIIGNHSIRFGGDIRYALNLRNSSDYNQSGILSFGNGSTGSGIASVLMGYVDTFQRYDIYSLNAANRQKRGSFYAEDRWRVTPTFTLNYGLRWDIVFPETVNRPEAGGFTNLNTGYIQVAGVGGFGTNGGAKVDLSDFGGRVGFAWQLHPTTVLRAAAAQMYDDEGMFGTIFGSVLTHNIPVYNDEDVTSGNGTGKYSYTYPTLPAAPPPYFVPSTGLIPLPNGVNTEIRPITLILPRVDQYNLSLQQQITNDMTFTIGVVGNVAERIYPSETYGYNVNVPMLPITPADLTATDPNPPAPCVPGSPAGCSRDQRRPYYDRFSHPYNGLQVNCCTQDITSAAPAAHSHYTALEASIQQRFSHGLQFDSHYTWSRAMNYGATYFAQNPLVEYGPTDTNRANVFLLNGLWDLPVGRGKAVNLRSRILDTAIGGWRLGASTTWESGLPFTVTYAECGSDQDIDSNFASPGTSSDCRPDKGVGTLATHVSGLNTTTHSRMYFTPVAPLTASGVASGPFVRPAFGTIGTVGRNSYRGPREYFADASLFKTVRIKEKVNAQFQFQTFNLFNHAPLGVPSGSQARCIDCSTATGDAGLITSVDSAVSGTGMPYMRTLQFGARFEF
jgi:hypothetical protein